MHGDRAISGVEYVLDDSIAMISKGDLDGKITYANRDFVQVSGYSEDQLLGAPQSLLAHPDTPREVFEDFLRTVGANKTWTGIAKGLRRNGDHFWVEMTAAPIHANHRTVGYITIRAKAAPEKVRLANQAYSAMKSGRADFALQGGTIVKRSPLTRARGLSRLSVATKMNVLTALTTVLCAGNLAALAVLKAEADGYTVFVTTNSTQAANINLFNAMPYDPRADFAPVAGIMTIPMMLAVKPEFPAQSVAEFIAMAKTRPGQLNYGSAGLGSPPHMAAALFTVMAGVEIEHIP